MPIAFRPSSRSRSLTLATTALMAGLVLASAIAIWLMRAGAIANTIEDNHRLGVVIAEQTARTFQAADSVLEQVSEAIVSSGVDDLKALHNKFGGAEYHEALARRLIDLPQTASFVIFDAAGNFVNDSTQWPLPDYSNINRTYFRHFLTDPGPAPYFSEPVVSRSLDFRTTVLSRRITGPNGTFLGVVIAAIRLDYFDTLFAREVAGQIRTGR